MREEQAEEGEAAERGRLGKCGMKSKTRNGNGAETCGSSDVGVAALTGGSRRGGVGQPPPPTSIPPPSPLRKCMEEGGGREESRPQEENEEWVLSESSSVTASAVLCVRERDVRVRSGSRAGLRSPPVFGSLRRNSGCG
ncbi:hypothetical protein JZ751_028321 [Albula glossodonta]|uniref:Uncharacterized protein n=1 Tax=Albula glossodonta TaxID=121402 RepID=A0A8T2NFH0_9TELE|nr:hypothetical protein JZ751_028321 [Albula glossodonta]